MGLISIFQESPVVFFIIAIALVLSLAVHEWAHAYAADRLGDNTPRSHGRVTLNPIAHLDPFGTLLLLFAGFGFAKPVPVNPYKLGRWGGLWVALAGPLSNMVIAILCIIIMKMHDMGIELFSDSFVFWVILVYVMSVNVILAIFNLLPIPMLDGSRILGALFPPFGKLVSKFDEHPYGFVAVIIIIYAAGPFISEITMSVVEWLQWLS